MEIAPNNPPPSKKKPTLSTGGEKKKQANRKTTLKSIWNYNSQVHLDKIWHQLPQENLVHELLPSCLNLLLLHIAVSGMHSGQVLCLHACVCLEPAALVVLVTQWTAPVSCFLECVWARVTAAACVSTQFTLLLVHCAFSRVSSPNWTHPHQVWCSCPATQVWAA